MKLLFALLMIVATSSICEAQSLQLLQNPPPASANWVCAGTGFTDAGLPHGICEQKIHTSMRYAQPARYQYLVTWDAAGAVTVGPLYCYSKAHLGSDLSGCFAMVHYSDTGSVIVIGGLPLWYVSSNSAGAMLVNSQTDAFIWSP